MTTIEAFLRDVNASLQASEEDKRLIVDELRTHLVEQARERHAARPMASRDEIEAEVVAEFGDARELAIAFSSEGERVLQRPGGDIVLRLNDAVNRGARYVAKHGPAAARSVGRGATKVLKVVAATLGVLLVLSIGVGAWAYYEVKPYIPAIIEQSQPAFSYSELCRSTPCAGETQVGTFYVSPDAQSVRMSFDVYPLRTGGDDPVKVGNGTFSVTITDPQGATAFTRAFNMTPTSWLHYETTWAAVPGTWKVHAGYDGFVGGISMDARPLVLPWGER